VLHLAEGLLNVFSDFWESVFDEEEHSMLREELQSSVGMTIVLGPQLSGGEFWILVSGRSVRVSTFPVLNSSFTFGSSLDVRILGVVGGIGTAKVPVDSGTLSEGEAYPGKVVTLRGFGKELGPQDRPWETFVAWSTRLSNSPTLGLTF